MFDLGFGIGEIILISAAALVVIGPHEFPKMLYHIGRFFRQIKDIGREFTHTIDEAVHDQEVRAMRKEIAQSLEKEKNDNQ